MLDEILEYRQYSLDIDSLKVDENLKNPEGRLKRRTLITNDFSGLNRALTVIARHFLFEVYVNDSDRIEKTKDALKSWMGHKKPPEDADEEVHALYRWLPEYAEKVLLAFSLRTLKKEVQKSSLSQTDKFSLEDLSDGIFYAETPEEKVQLANRLLESLEDLSFTPKNSVHKAVFNSACFLKQLSGRRSFNRSGYADMGEANDFNAISYDKVIGNALRAGVLKKYYLACDRDCLSMTEKRDPFAKMKTNDRDVVLKMTACCMLQLSKKGKRCVEQTRAVHINQSDFINWLILQKCYKEHLIRYYYKNEVLFEHVTLSGWSVGDENKKGTNVKKIRLNQKWLEDSGFEILIDDPERDVIRDYLDFHPDGCVYIDSGAEDSLTVIYSS